MKELASNKKFLYLGLSLVLLICGGIRWNVITERPGFHLDEIASITLSNYSEYGYGTGNVFDDDSRMYTGKEVKAVYYSDENSFSEICKDIWRLRKDTRDHSHSNLYYSLLRLSFWGADTSTVEGVLFRAGLLNMLMFLITFFFIFRFCRLFSSNNFVVLGILLMAFLSIGTINSTVNFRCYQVQEMMFAILTYVSFSFFLSIYKDNMVMSVKQAVVYALLMALGTLTGYFAISYVLMLWGCLLLMCLLKKRWRSGLTLGAALVLAVAFVFIIYPNFMAGLTSQRGEEALTKIEVNFFSYFYGGVVRPTLQQMNEFYIGVDKLIVLFILMFAGLSYHRYKEKIIDYKIIFLIVLILICFLWIVVTVYFAPWKGAHYYRTIFPVLTVAIFIPIFYPQIRGYYLLLILVPAFFFIQMTIFTLNPIAMKKGNMAIIFAGEENPSTQQAVFEFFNDDRLVGFSRDKDNLEAKLEQLNDTAMVAIQLEEGVVNIYTKDEYLGMDSFKKFIDTAKIEVIDSKMHYSTHTLFYVRKRTDK